MRNIDMRSRPLAPLFAAALWLVPGCGPRPEAEAAAHVSSGLTLAGMGQTEAAAHELELGLRLAPRHHEAWMRLARIRLDQGRFAEARAAATQFAALRPRSPYARELLGRAALGLHDDATAARELSQALALDPGRGYLHVTLGRMHERGRRYSDAIMSYTRAMEALPGVAEPRIGYARSLLAHLPTADNAVAAVADSAGRLLDEARSAKAVTDAQRAEIVRLSAYVERLRAERDRREQRVVDGENARARALAQARTFGILGLLGSRGPRSGIVSPWGRDTGLGSDASGVLGGLMGDQIGDSFGYGGLGLRGSGLGGGGTGEGTIGLGNLGTIGHGAGGGSGSGYGRGAGGFGRAQGTATARVSTPSVRGSIPSEIVGRILVRHTNELRFCYERGLVRNPTLSGRVSLRLVIAPSGTTSSATVASSTLGDATVDACLLSAARRWIFPASPGIAIVDVPVTFAH